MVTAFQPNAFQNNAFQIIIAVSDTHDGLPKKFYLPIYESSKKERIHKKIDNLSQKFDVEIEIEEGNAEQRGKLIENAKPVFLKKWDNSTIEAHAKATSQTIEQVKKKLEVLQKYEDELNSEEDDFFTLVMLALS